MASQRDDSSNEMEARLLDLHEQLASARSAFRAEKERAEREHQDDLSALAAARHEAEAREEQANAERIRLVHLRKRFIERCKRKWTEIDLSMVDERNRFAVQSKVIQAQSAKFEEEKARFELNSANEKTRIQKCWEDLSAEEQEWTIRRKLEESDFHQRKLELERYAEHLAEAEKAWQAKEIELRTACEERGRELVGLEFRISALREQLPADRFDLPGDATQPALPSSQSEHRGDERLLLEEQTRHLHLAREEWQIEQKELLGDFEELAVQILDRERTLDQRESSIIANESLLHQERLELKKWRKGLKGREAKLRNREATRVDEKESLEAEIRYLHRHRKQAFSGLTRLVETWTQRQENYRDDLRGEQNRCKAMLEIWIDNLKVLEAERTEVRDAAIRQAKQSLILESVRLGVTEKSEKPELAEKLFERFQRRLDRTLLKTEGELGQRRASIASLIQELKDCEAKVEDRIQALESERSEFEARRLNWEGENFAQQDERHRLEGEVQILEEQQLRQEEKTRQLRSEIERLSGLLFDEESVPRSLAA